MFRSAVGLVVGVVACNVALAEYCPEVGRFLQRDIYRSGLPTINEPIAHGRAPTSHVEPFCPLGHCDGGMNLYQYVAGNPLNLVDPLGMDWLDDLGIDTGVQSWGSATAQISVESGQLFSIANMEAAFAEAFLALTGGFGSAMEKIADCVQAGDPASHLNWISETVVKLGPALFSPLPKGLMYSGEEAALAKATGTPGTPFTRFAFGGLKMGWISEKTFSQLKNMGRAISNVATPVTIVHGLYLAGLELYCGVKHGILGY